MLNTCTRRLNVILSVLWRERKRIWSSGPRGYSSEENTIDKISTVRRAPGAFGGAVSPEIHNPSAIYQFLKTHCNPTSIPQDVFSVSACIMESASCYNMTLHGPCGGAHEVQSLNQGLFSTSNIKRLKWQIGQNEMSIM